MNGGSLPNISFRSFYVSREVTNSPLLVDIIKIGKKLKQVGILTDETSATISLSFGKRILINGEVDDFSSIKKEEIVEIADYDPIKKALLVIGPIEPKIETPIHWMIHHARGEVNSVVQIYNNDLASKLVEKLPMIDDKYPPGSIEDIKEVLKGLRDSEKVILRNESVLFVGNRIDDVQDLILKTFEEIK